VTVPGAVLTIPRTLPPGSYEACAVLDRTDVVPESLETNNFTCVPVVINQPDLQVAVTRSPPNPTSVDLVTFTVTVLNAGPGSALASTLSFPLPADDGGTTFAVPELAPGASFVKTRTGTFGAATYPGVVTADFGDAVAESNENNNQADNTFTVVPPRLVFTTQPSSTFAGELFSPAVAVAVQNAAGETVTGYTGDITIAVLDNPAPRLLQGTRTKPATSGAATFNDLYLTRFGTYQLVASSPGVTSATSTVFNVTDLSVLNTDVAYAGFGGMRGNGEGSITLSGVSGTVTKAMLFWHGPTNSSNPAVNAVVTFNGTNVTGSNIGFAFDNNWGFANSQAYRANVTSLVSGNGPYTLANFLKTHLVGETTVVDADINGVSLVVFFNDGNAANNKNVYFRNVNDSNGFSEFDNDEAWDQTLGGVAYSGGAAQVVLHVGDGQQFDDAAVLLNGTTIAGGGPLFDGSSVPNGAYEGNGGLWDIKAITIPDGILNSGGGNTLTITTAQDEDYLSLVVMMIVVDKAAPPAPPPAAAAVIDAERSTQLRNGLRRH
jgi:hypothetical protein